MDTELLVYLNDKWQLVDLYENISIDVMIQELDLKILDERKSYYSKQFVVPNTSNNAIFLSTILKLMVLILTP